MPNRTYKINGETFTMTDEENTARDAEELHYNTVKKPMRDWKLSMQRTDDFMPRVVEDILDGMPDKSGVAQITLDRLQAKKTKRGERP